jgi:hypothetical protein
MIAAIIAQIRTGDHDASSIGKVIDDSGYSAHALIFSLIKTILIEPVVRAKAEAKDLAAATGADEETEVNEAVEKIKTELEESVIWKNFVANLPPKKKGPAKDRPSQQDPEQESPSL